MKLLFVLLVVLFPFAWTASPIEHVIVLMMENRSFDHLLGFLGEKNVDGLTGNESNSYNASDPSSTKVTVSNGGYDTGPDDPGHSFQDTFQQIYGQVPTAHQTESNLPPTMSGFVQDAVGKGHDPTNPMRMFDPTSAPIINTLAKEFAVFDRWFCSLPGPTDPNRAFWMSGTSNGMTTNFNGTLWSQTSHMAWLQAHNRTFRGYYQDDPWALMYFADMHQPKQSQHVHDIDQFYVDLDNDDLAQYTLLQPRMTSHKGPPTWQHPDASVREGERLMKQVYEAIRASKAWEKTLFVITYDEHGGFYDHVAPPQTGIPAPDGVRGATVPFAYDRLGIRIPTIAISPFIPKNTVVHEPKGPTPTSQFDATSIIATVNKIFGLDSTYMTERDRWAGRFDDVLSLHQARTDCPTKLPDLDAYTNEEWEAQKARPLNDHMQIQVHFYCQQNYNLEVPAISTVITDHHVEVCPGFALQTQGEASEWIAAEADRFMQRVKFGA